jgi:peptidoglycan glycosyltransferase
LVYGATGLERIYNDLLSGRDDRLAVDRLQQLLAGKEPRGGVVTLTIHPKMQQAGFKAMAGRAGSLVALNPATGEILALVSTPSYDPTKLSINDPSAVRQAYESLLDDEREPMLNRPLTKTLPPGSTFKLVVVAAALNSGQFTANSIIPGPATIKLPNSTKLLGNWQGTACSPSGKLTLRRALEVSCNTAFAWLGMKLGADAISAQAEKFGFNQSFSVPLVSASSVFPAGLDGAQTAMSAIGQFDVRATTLQMAMVTSAITNGGLLMKPYLVKDIRTSELELLETTNTFELGQAQTPEQSQVLLDMMRSVVSKGTATSGKISGVLVGAKTGTAETGTEALPHAWFVATATYQGRSIVVAVVIENGGGQSEVSGNRIAGPIAASVIKAAFL